MGNAEDGKPLAVKRYYRIKVIHSNETLVAAWTSEEPLPGGELVLVPTRYGKDYGTALGPVCEACVGNGRDVCDVIRVATAKDRSTEEKNRRKAQDAEQVCRERIAVHNLEMKLVSAHFLPEESKALFFFTADERVDFRDLVKDLVAVFRMRIELRQIGVRDESRVIGGVAVCGRPYCCHGVSDKLRPVSIRMAKEQNLSLNSMKISGPCGRLLCCLSYEFDFYREEKSKMPAEGSRIRYEDALFKVQEVNILARTVRLTAQDGRVRDLSAAQFVKNDQTGKWEVVQPTAK